MPNIFEDVSRGGIHDTRIRRAFDQLVRRAAQLFGSNVLKIDVDNRIIQIGAGDPAVSPSGKGAIIETTLNAASSHSIKVLTVSGDFTRTASIIIDHDTGRLRTRWRGENLFYPLTIWANNGIHSRIEANVWTLLLQDYDESIAFSSINHCQLHQSKNFGSAGAFTGTMLSGNTTLAVSYPEQFPSTRSPSSGVVPVVVATPTWDTTIWVTSITNTGCTINVGTAPGSDSDVHIHAFTTRAT